jgi:heterotetrameric sarcosine oxidase gamma subunit
MDEVFQSPLAPLGAEEGVYLSRDLRFTAHHGLGHVQLRLADPRSVPDLAVLERFEQRAALRLPRAGNRAEGEDPTWIRHAPSRWLALAAPARTKKLLQELEAAADAEIGVFDLTAARFAVEVAGMAAGDLLACGCPLDLALPQFAVEQCASTLLAQAPVLLRRRAVDRFDVHVDAALAPYLWRWLRDAAREFEAV